MVEAHPIGAQIQVFYDPRRPEDSILKPGLLGSDLFLVMFITPFNAVMIGFWSVGITRWYRRRFKPVAGGIKIISDSRRTRARLAVSPLIVIAVTTAILAFLCIFVICIFYDGFHPTMRTMRVAWSVILLGGIANGMWQWFNILSGKHDLIINHTNKVVELPLTHGRKKRRRVSFDAVQCIRVETVRPVSSDGEISSPTYAPKMEISGSEPKFERLVEWRDREKAEAFTDWLRSELPVRSPPARSLSGRF